MKRALVTTAETSARMKLIRRSNTAPEQAVRAIVRRLGLRYRVAPRSLPGTPDIANVSSKWAIFVHGCFWHGHTNCRLFTTPKTNTKFWIDKVAGNKSRDARKAAALRRLGFRVVTIWQCELAFPDRLERKLRRMIVEDRR